MYGSSLAARSCPAVILAQRLDMEKRQLECAVTNDERDLRFVGGMAVGQDILFCANQQGTLQSVRGLDERDDNLRVVTDTPASLREVELLSLSDTFDQMSPNSLTRAFIQKNIFPMSLAEDRPSGGVLLFFTHQPEVPEHSRTGVLGGYGREGNPGPIVASLNGEKYFVEIKGAGNPAGKFTKMDQSVGSIVLGALPLEDAEREFDFLTKASSSVLTPVLPLAMAKVDIGGVDSDFGVVMRLSPSTIRLSHEGYDGCLPIDSREDTDLILSLLVENLINKFLGGSSQPIFLSPASHLENYLVTEGVTISETDFEDFRELGGLDVPFVHEQTGKFIDMRLILKHYFDNFTRVKGYDPEQHEEFLAVLMQERLQARGVLIDFSNCKDSDEVAEKFWEDFVYFIDLDRRFEKRYEPGFILEWFSKRQLELEKESIQAPPREMQDLEEELVSGRLGDLSKLCNAMLTVLYLGGDTEKDNMTKYQIYKASEHYVFEELRKIYGEDLDASNLPENILIAVRYFQDYRRYMLKLFDHVDRFSKWAASEFDYMQRANDLGRIDGAERLLAGLNVIDRAAFHAWSSHDLEDISNMRRFIRDDVTNVIRDGYQSIFRTHGTVN